MTGTVTGTGTGRRELREAFRRLLTSTVPGAAAGTADADADLDPAFSAARAFGLFDPPGPESPGHGDLVAVFSELGRVLVGGDWFGPVLAAAGPGAAQDPVEVGLFVLAGNGTEVFRPGTGRADVLRFGVQPSASHGIVITGHECVAVDLDEGSRGPTTELGGHPAARHVVVPALRTAELPGFLRSRALLLAAAMATGIGERLVQDTVGHVSGRRQFGAPIGSFQAVKHRVAQMATRTQTASDAVELAASLVDDEGGVWTPFSRTPAAAAGAAFDVASRSAVWTARAHIQNLGALGFSQEHVAHRYLERALFLASLGSRLR